MIRILNIGTWDYTFLGKFFFKSHNRINAIATNRLDFYAIENGQKSGVTMGLATVGGVCIDQYQCIIAEFGTTNVFGKPYPSAGFTSIFILAHEIGHK